MRLALAILFAGAVASPHVVDVYDWLFEDDATGAPVTRAAPGEEILWRVTQGMHTVRSDTGAFASEPLLAGQEFSWRAGGTGAYTYYCEIHEWMRAIIVVAS